MSWTVRDVGDVSVWEHHRAPSVRLRVGVDDLCMTPHEARALATALEKAADQITGILG